MMEFNEALKTALKLLPLNVLTRLARDFGGA